MTETDVARLTRERDEARERAASLSRELLDAMQARDSYRASAELRVGMRREFEALLGVSGTRAPEIFEAGLARLRALLAAARRAEEAWAKAVHEMEARASDAVAHESIAALCAGTGLPLSKHMTTVEAVRCVVDALASERAARERAERELASVTTDRDSWAEQADQRAIEAVEYLGRAEAAEARAERLAKALREIESRTGHFGEAPQPPEWMPMLSLIAWVGRTARAAIAAEEGKS